jgi:hypothetical protein
MKFPITRESLQTFNIEKEKKEIDDITIKEHINSVVNEICQELENLFLWEKSTIYINDPREDAHKKLMNEKRFIWKGLVNITTPTFSGPSIDVKASVLIPLLVVKLAETFIGCDIIIDPLKTYLIIDWS